MQLETTLGLNGLLTMPPPLPTIMSHSTDMALGGPSTAPEVSILPALHNTFALVGSGSAILLCLDWPLLSSRGRSRGLERLFEGRGSRGKETKEQKIKEHSMKKIRKFSGKKNNCATYHRSTRFCYVRELLSTFLHA